MASMTPGPQARGGLAGQVFSPGGQQKSQGQAQPPRPQDLELMWRALMTQPPGQAAPPTGGEARQEMNVPPPDMEAPPSSFGGAWEERPRDRA